jgi:glutathione S-transferase
LCDGILDASILTIYEGRWRAPDKHEPKWLEHQAGKVERAFAFLEARPAGASARRRASACGSDYACLHAWLSRFRFAGSWRKDHPRLVAWLDDFYLKDIEIMINKSLISR